MKLCTAPAPARSPHIVLRESGLAFQPVLASTKTHKLADGTDYYTINPKGVRCRCSSSTTASASARALAIVQHIADPGAGQGPRSGERHDGAYRLQGG